MRTVEIVVTKLPANVSSTMCQLAVEEVEQAVKNYCDIVKVPDELRFVVANMAVDLVRYQLATQKADAGAEEDVTLNDVSSLTIGDTKVELKGEEKSSTLEAKAQNSHTPNLDGIVMNYRAQLNKFRRMCW